MGTEGKRGGYRFHIHSTALDPLACSEQIRRGSMISAPRRRDREFRFAAFDHRDLPSSTPWWIVCPSITIK
jgi:hypothetical protein